MDFASVRAQILARQKEQRVLIASHRGCSGGSIVQNTIMAYKNALLHGADIIEMDVIQSTDGVFFALHDGVERQVFQMDTDIRTKTAAQIEALPLINPIGMPMATPLCRMDDVLEEFRGKCLINVDRSWYYWEAVIEQLRRHNMDDQIILKSHVDERLMQILADKGGPLMYMPILKNEQDYAAELARVEQYPLNVIAAEVLMMTPDGVRNAPALTKQLHDKGILSWVNTLTLCDKFPTALLAHIPEELKNSSEFAAMAPLMNSDKRISFCYGMDDNAAIDGGPDGAWGKLIEMGFDVLQTDWPALVKNFVTGAR